MATATPYGNSYVHAGSNDDDMKQRIIEEGGAPASGSYSSFMNQRVRMGFIRKVYGILSVQLAITFGITFVFVLNEGVKSWVYAHPGALYSAMAIQIVLAITLACCRDTTRVVPYNYILLFGFTLAESYLVGTISSFYDTDVVLIAFGIAMGVTIGLTIFAFQTKFDFTVFYGLMFSLLVSLLIFGFLMIWLRSSVLRVVYAWIGALIFAGYLVIDTQMIIGGKHKIQFTPDEYIAAALNLYLDIVQMFLYMLRIVASAKK